MSDLSTRAAEAVNAHQRMLRAERALTNRHKDLQHALAALSESDLAQYARATSTESQERA